MKFMGGIVIAVGFLLVSAAWHMHEDQLVAMVTVAMGFIMVIE